MSADDDLIPLPSYVPPHRPSRQLIAGLVIVVIVVVASLAAVLLRGTPAKVTAQKAAHPLYVDSAKDKVTITDSTGKSLSQLPYPANAYVNFEAVSPSGGALLSMSITSTEEGYMLIKDGKNIAPSNQAVKALRTAVVLGTTHRVFFTSEDNVVMVVCGDTCKLDSLNLISGKSQLITDTGVKPVAGPVAVYLLGVSGDLKSAYLRVNAANKLSSDKAAVYQIDLASHKVLHTIPVSVEAGYDLALSPDNQKLAYTTGGYGNPVTLNVINLANNKKTSTKWGTAGTIDDSPWSLQWSPDSSKVLFYSMDIVLPAEAPAATQPLALAYLNIAKNTITDLQTVNDPAFKDIRTAGWLSNSQVIYEQDTATQRYSFDNAAGKVFAQDVTAKQGKTIEAPGKLISVIYW